MKQSTTCLGFKFELVDRGGEHKVIVSEQASGRVLLETRPSSITGPMFSSPTRVGFCGLEFANIDGTLFFMDEGASIQVGPVRGGNDSVQQTCDVWTDADDCGTSARVESTSHRASAASRGSASASSSGTFSLVLGPRASTPASTPATSATVGTPPVSATVASNDVPSPRTLGMRRDEDARTKSMRDSEDRRIASQRQREDEQTRRDRKREDDELRRERAQEDRDTALARQSEDMGASAAKRGRVLSRSHAVGASSRPGTGTVVQSISSVRSGVSVSQVVTGSGASSSVQQFIGRIGK